MIDLDTVYGVDVTEIMPWLWMGSLPREGDVLHRAGFDVLALVAEDMQSTDAKAVYDLLLSHASECVGNWQKIEILRAPLDDPGDAMRPGDDVKADRVASEVAARIFAGRTVLVTCFSGGNRSGLVCALTLLRLTRLSPAACIEWIRAKRKDALGNPAFVKYIMGC